MVSDDGAGPPTQAVGQPRRRGWGEMLGEFPAIRQVFHALCALGDDEDASGLLGFAARQEWMADLARRAAAVARAGATAPFEPGDKDLLETLWELYAASRVRDVLLLAHQPAPAGSAAPELDAALGRQQPGFRPVPVDQITGFFAAIGCQPVTESSFDPILHEILTCQAATEPDAPIQIAAQAWPASDGEPASRPHWGDGACAPPPTRGPRLYPRDDLSPLVRVLLIRQ